MNSAPGVSVRELFSLSLAIRSNATAVPVIIGSFVQTAKPVSGCVRVNDWLDFASKFDAATAKAIVQVESKRPPESASSTKEKKAPASGADALAGDYTYEFTSAIAYNYDVLALAHYFNNGGDYCYLLPGASAADRDRLAADIRKQPDISLLVVAGTPNTEAIYTALNTLLTGDEGYFLIAHGTRVADTATPTTQAAQTAFYYPYLHLPYKYQRDDQAVVVKGYADKDSPDGTIDITLSDLKTRNPALYALICADLDNPDKHPPVLPIPPSAAVAGAYCRTDRQRGVWKAPANVALSSVLAVDSFVSEDDHADFNSKGVNVIRSFSDRKAVIYGARTLVPEAETDWLYVPVRRLFNAAQRDIRQAMQFAVFELNSALTWERVRAAIDSYLHSLWKQGALTGSSPQEAYFVQIGKDITMSDEEIRKGIMRVKVGMAAVRPAEFIILEFTQEVG